MEYALTTNSLTKKYGAKNAVDHVNMTVQKGDIYGFVGKNGAGKTTLIRLVLGLASPTSGSFQLFGEMNHDKARRKVGNLIESPAIYPNMTGTQNLTAYCKLLGVDETIIPELLDTVGLGNTGKKKARDFSLGMKQRLGIAISLIGNPEFLILDEPINGLDPEGIVEVRDLILKLNREHGKTVLISSHILGELNKMATRYGIINSGKLVEEISHADLIKKCTASTIIKTNNIEKSIEIISNMLKSQGEELPHMFVNNNGAIIINKELEDSGAIAKALFSNDIIVESLSTEGSDLENYFISKMGE